MNCPLCGAASALFHELKTRRWYRCPTCDLVALDATSLPSPDEEVARYREHNNDPADERYRAFLGKILDALAPSLAPGARGLDFGCGPAPVLADLFRGGGYAMEVYDPFFHPDPAPLARTYDFVVCTEAAEHFHAPAREWDRLRALVSPTGSLGVMTLMLEDWRDFPTWHYPRDPTHVVFYSRATMAWLGRRHGWRPRFVGRDITLFEPPLNPGTESADSRD